MIALETAIEKWKREGISLHHPIERSVFAAKLSALSRSYSSDLLDLYAETGGMKDGESDSHLWSLWPVEKVISETAAYNRPYILFADFSINSHLYCLKYENERQSSVAIDYFNGEEPKRIAEGIEEFFQIFNRDPAKLQMFE